VNFSVVHKSGIRYGFFTALMLVVLLLPDKLQAQQDVIDYGARFTALHKAYSKNPHDEATLYQLALFYFDNSNPMRNLPMAIDFARLTEERHVDLLQRDRVRDLVKLQRDYNITLTTIRELEQAINDAAYEMVRLREDLTMSEIDTYIAHFSDNADLLRLLRIRRYRLTFNNVINHGDADACYAFITTYQATAEAKQLDERLGRLAAEVLSTTHTETDIDSLVARYPQSAAVRRAAGRRKSQLAFHAADRDGSIAAYNVFLSRYPASDESEMARTRIDDLLEIDLAKRTTAMELAHFADSNADLDIADQALARLRAIIYSRHDAEAAQYYVDHFRLDPYRSEVYSHYYSWHSVEGNGAPLRRFAAANPDFPFARALEDDLLLAEEIDAAPLLDDYVEKAYDRYADYVRQMMGKAIAVVPLQRMLQPLVKAHRYDDALFRMSQLEICFDNQWQSQYDELRRLLTAPATGRPLHSELADSGIVSHPVINPADDCLYYSDGSHILRAVYVKGSWQTSDTVRFVNADASNLTFFGFYAGGSRMLLGSGGDIWIAEPDGDGWRISDIPPYPVNTDFIETDAFMLPDGSGMLLASDRPGGLNLQSSGDNFHGDTALATDLWFIPYTNHLWGTPVNLGLKINTIYSERCPVLSRNMRTLYFVSDGYTGLGYGDVYVVERSDVSDWTSWGQPRNLGREVNSSFREGDISLSPDERRLYLSSNASGRWSAYSVATDHNGSGAASVYSVNVGDVDQSLVRLYVADVDHQAVTQVIDSDNDSILDVSMLDGSRYALLADAGTQFVTATIVDRDLMNVYRLPAYTYEDLVAMDRPLPLPVIEFSSDGTELLPVARLQLEQMARFLAMHPSAIAEFIVDVPGTDAEHCYELSLNRCEVLRDFLSQRGIATSRILLSPYGNARSSLTGTHAVSVRFRE